MHSPHLISAFGIVPEAKLALSTSYHYSSTHFFLIDPPQHQHDLAYRRRSCITGDDDKNQVQARLEDLAIGERPNRKRKASTADSEEVEDHAPTKRPNIDRNLLDDPFDEHKIDALGKQDGLGGRLDSVNQDSAKAKAMPILETKRGILLPVLDVDDSTFSLEAVFATARDTPMTLDSEEARQNPHWKKYVLHPS